MCTIYLVRTNSGDKIVDTAEEIKELDKLKIRKIYSLSEVDYDSLVSTSDIRDCIYSLLKGDQVDRNEVINYVAEKLDIKKKEVSKVITAMKKEKVIYVVEEFDWLGIN